MALTTFKRILYPPAGYRENSCQQHYHIILKYNYFQQEDFENILRKTSAGVMTVAQVMNLKRTYAFFLI